MTPELHLPLPPRARPDIATLVKLRAARAEDRDFVLSSWLRSYRNSDAAKGLEGQTYYTQQRATIERLLSRSSGLVACQPSDESEILGWLVVEPKSAVVVHFVYVKHLLRREGVATHLLQSVLDALGDSPPMLYTHRNGVRCRRLMAKFNATYHPQFAR